MTTISKILNTEIGAFLVADRGFMNTKSAKIIHFLHPMPNGKYLVDITVNATTGLFSGKKITKSGILEVTSAQVFIGDPCAVFRADTWDKFLKATNFFKKPSNHYVNIDVGGDGKGKVSVEFTKVK